jgi:UPF0716 family protein affecting phage T7 exclusion
MKRLDRRTLILAGVASALIGCDGNKDGQTSALDGASDEALQAGEAAARVTSKFAWVILAGELILLPEPTTSIVGVCLIVAAVSEIAISYINDEQEERRFKYELSEKQYNEISTNGYVEFKRQNGEIVKRNLDAPEYDDK